MLKRLVVEFKDELEALGVKVAELDERVAVLEDRLGGWKISGVLALDVTYRKNREPDNANPGDDGGDTSFTFDDAKLLFERWWGEDEQYYFRARFNGGDYANAANFDRFYVEMPFFFDTRLTVGRFSWAWEGDYRVKSNIGNAETGSFGESAQIMTDWGWAGFGLTKNFGLGTFNMVVAHPNNILSHGYRDARGATQDWDDWMLMMRGTFQFTEQVGFDLGGALFIGDNAEEKSGNNTYLNNDTAFDKMWEIYAGLRFNFNDNIAFKGIFYHQKMDMDVLNIATNTWQSRGYNRWNTGNNWVDDANHWALILDVKQEALKYTSLWLEYGQFDQGFITRNGSGIFSAISANQAPNDMKYWRIALGQEWNDKWATHIFYYGYKVDNGIAAGTDWKPSELGLGVQYKLNDSTTMGLNYVHIKDATAAANADDDDQIRFRTSISF
jgi:hypothetical protein